MALTHILKQQAKPLQSLLRTLATLEELHSLFSACVSPELAAHCQVVRFEKNCLIVLVTSAGWATQLRFQLPNIIPKLKAHPVFYQLNGICSHVRPYAYHAYPSDTLIRQMNPLTPETAKIVNDIAQSISNEPLRGALKKIAAFK